MLRILGGLILAGVLCVGAIALRLVILESRINRDASQVKTVDAIIVLGAQVKEDGTPSVQLSLRLDAAAQAWERQRVPVVVCGAQGKDEPAPEADVMREELMLRGVQEDMILTDPNSRDTKQNILNAALLLEPIPDIHRVLIVTSDYHLPRALALALDAGLEAEGLGSPCKPEFWLKNHARETLAWGKYWLEKYLNVQIII